MPVPSTQDENGKSQCYHYRKDPFENWQVTLTTDFPLYLNCITWLIYSEDIFRVTEQTNEQLREH